MSGSSLQLTARVAFDGFHLEVAEQIPLAGVTALFGPSGSGKTSVLSLIAGFLRPQAGTISFNRESWYAHDPKHWTPPHLRGVGSVFQDAQLFDHLNVGGNLDYSQKRADDTAPGYARSDIVSAMELAPLLDRRPQTLSGGEKQRVAIARTLLTRPRLLLLDEPLSALDTARKSELLPFLETLKTDFALPTIYVSHDVDEVSRIADRVMMMEAGKIIATGPTDEVLSRFGLEAGRNPYETTSLLRGKLGKQDPESGLLAVELGDTSMWLAAKLDLPLGSEVRLKIAARDVALALERPAGISIQNMIPASIVALESTKRPAFQSIVLDVHGQELRATVTRKSVRELGLISGQNVFALIKSATFQA